MSRLSEIRPENSTNPINSAKPRQSSVGMASVGAAPDMTVGVAVGIGCIMEVAVGVGVGFKVDVEVGVRVGVGVGPTVDVGVGVTVDGDCTTICWTFPLLRAPATVSA